MSTSPEQHEFQTEGQQLLNLMVHSLYSNKDIFLRELISNASDALDRRRFAALSDESLAVPDGAGIAVSVDAEPRVLWVKDDGIGMSRAETVENLGTIARSGTQDFLRRLKDADGEGMTTLRELQAQEMVTDYALTMLAPDRAAAEELADHLCTLLLSQQRIRLV